jgi:hypothetical protein
MTSPLISDKYKIEKTDNDLKLTDISGNLVFEDSWGPNYETSRAFDTAEINGDLCVVYGHKNTFYFLNCMTKEKVNLGGLDCFYQKYHSPWHKFPYWNAAKLSPGGTKLFVCTHDGHRSGDFFYDISDLNNVARIKIDDRLGFRFYAGIYDFGEIYPDSKWMDEKTFRWGKTSQDSEFFSYTSFLI